MLGDVYKRQDYLKDLKLVDYKVRILNTGTEATTRVSIESTDSQGKNWFTIGVSPNIIDASFKALIEFFEINNVFKLNLLHSSAQICPNSPEPTITMSKLSLLFTKINSLFNENCLTLTFNLV